MADGGIAAFVAVFTVAALAYRWPLRLPLALGFLALMAAAASHLARDLAGAETLSVVAVLFLTSALVMRLVRLGMATPSYRWLMATNAVRRAAVWRNEVLRPTLRRSTATLARRLLRILEAAEVADEGAAAHRGPWQRRSPALYYAFLALLVTWPLYTGRYFIALDAVFGPNLDSLRFLDGTLRFEGPWVLAVAAVDGLTRLAGGAFANRALFFAIFWFMGWGMHRLCPAEHAVGKYFAGTLFVVNPFTYIRMISGQWLVLLSLAALPLALLHLRRLLRGEWRAAPMFAVTTTLAFSQIQFVLLLLVFMGFVVAAHAAQRGAGGWRPAWALALGGLGVLGINAFWWIPLLVEGSHPLASIGDVDFRFFSPRASSDLGVPFELLALYGFWRPGYALPMHQLPLWWLWPVALVWLSVNAVVQRGPDRRFLAGVAAAAVATYLLALGGASPLTAGGFRFLWDHVPAVRALRDSHKLVAGLLVGYAILGGVSAAKLARIIRLRIRSLRWGAAALAALVVLPAVAAYPMAMGYQDQVRGVDYPDDWYGARRIVEPRGAGLPILFLPWHLYMDYAWLPLPQPRAGNVAASFFESPVVAGDNVEIRGAFTLSNDPVSKYVESLLFFQGFAVGNPLNETHFGSLISPLGIRHVVLAKEADWLPYWNFLLTQTDLRLVFDSPRMAVFENRVDVGRVVASGAVLEAKTFQEIVAFARDYPLNQVVVRTTATTVPPDRIEGEPVASRAELASVHAEATHLPYRTLAVGQGNTWPAWTWEGEPVQHSLGFLPTGPGGGSGSFSNERFWDLLVPGYLVSGLTLLVLAAVRLPLRTRRNEGRHDAEPQRGEPDSQHHLHDLAEASVEGREQGQLGQRKPAQAHGRDHAPRREQVEEHHVEEPHGPHGRGEPAEQRRGIDVLGTENEARHRMGGRPEQHGHRREEHRGSRDGAQEEPPLLARIRHRFRRERKEDETDGGGKEENDLADHGGAGVDSGIATRKEDFHRNDVHVGQRGESEEGQG